MSNRSSSSINKTENIGLIYTKFEAKSDKTVPEILSINVGKNLNQLPSFSKTDNSKQIDAEEVIKNRFLLFEPTNLQSKKVVRITRLRQSIKNSLKKLINFLTRPEPLGSSFLLLVGLFTLKRANNNFSPILPMVKDCLPSFNSPSQELSWESYQLFNKEWSFLSQSKNQAFFPQLSRTKNTRSFEVLSSTSFNKRSKKSSAVNFRQTGSATSALFEGMSHNGGEVQGLNCDNIFIQRSVSQLQNSALKQKGFFISKKRLSSKSFFLTNIMKSALLKAQQKAECLEAQQINLPFKEVLETNPFLLFGKKGFGFSRYPIIPGQSLEFIAAEKLATEKRKLFESLKTSLRYWYSETDDFASKMNSRNVLLDKKGRAKHPLSGYKKEGTKKIEEKETVTLFNSFDQSKQPLYRWSLSHCRCIGGVFPIAAVSVDQLPNAFFLSRLFPYQKKLLKDLKATFYYKPFYSVKGTGGLFEKNPQYLSNLFNKKTPIFLDKKTLFLEKQKLLESYSFKKVSHSKPFIVGFKTPANISLNQNNLNLQKILKSDRVARSERKENSELAYSLFQGEKLNLTRIELDRAEQDWLNCFHLAVFENTEKQRAFIFPVRKTAASYPNTQKEVVIKPINKQKLSLKQLTFLEQSKVVPSLRRSLSLFEKLCYSLNGTISKKLKEKDESALIESPPVQRQVQELSDSNIKQKDFFPVSPKGFEDDINSFPENKNSDLTGIKNPEKRSLDGGVLLHLETNNLKKAKSTKFVLTEGEVEEKDSEKDGEKDGETKAPLEDLSLWLKDWSDWSVWSSKISQKNRNKVLATETSQLRKKIMTVLGLPYEKALRLTGKDLLYSFLETIEDGHTKDSFKGQPPTPDQDENSFRLSKPILSIKALLAGINSWEYNNHLRLTEEEMSFWPMVKPRLMASYRFLDLKSNDVQGLYALINYKDLLKTFSWSPDIRAERPKTFFQISTQNNTVSKSAVTGKAGASLALPIILFSEVTRGALKERAELMTNASFNQANAKRLFICKTIPQVSVRSPSNFTFGTFLGGFDKLRQAKQPLNNFDFETSAIGIWQLAIGNWHLAQKDSTDTAAMGKIPERLSRLKKTSIHQHTINQEPLFSNNYAPPSLPDFSLTFFKSHPKSKKGRIFVGALAQAESNIENQLLTKSFLPITNSIEKSFENITSESKLSVNKKAKADFRRKNCSRISVKNKSRGGACLVCSNLVKKPLLNFSPALSIIPTNTLQIKGNLVEKRILTKGLAEKPIQFRVRYNLFSSSERKIESKNTETSNKKTMGSLLNIINNRFRFLNLHLPLYRFKKESLQKDLLPKDEKMTRLLFSDHKTKKINVVCFNTKKQDNLSLATPTKALILETGTTGSALLSNNKGRYRKSDSILGFQENPLVKQTNLSNSLNERSYFLVGLLTRTANQDVLIKQRDKWLCANQLPNLLSNRSLTHCYKSNLAWLESVTSVNKKENKSLDFSKVSSIAKEQKSTSSPVLSWFLRILPNKAKNVLFTGSTARVSKSLSRITGSLFYLQTEPLYFGQAPSLWPFSYRNASSPNRARVKSASKTLGKGNLFNSEDFWGPGLSKPIKQVSPKTFFSPNENKILRDSKETGLKETKESLINKKVSLVSNRFGGRCKETKQEEQTSQQTWFVDKNSPKALNIEKRLERAAQVNSIIFHQRPEQVSSKRLKPGEQWLGPLHRHSFETRAWWADKEKNALLPWLQARSVDMYFINTRLGLAKKVAWWKKDYAGPITRKTNINDTIGDYIKEYKDKESFTNLTNQQLRLLANSYPKLESLESGNLRVLESEDKWYWGLSKIEAELNPKKEQEEKNKEEKQLNRGNEQETTFTIESSKKCSADQAKHLEQSLEKLHSALSKQSFDRFSGKCKKEEPKSLSKNKELLPFSRLDKKIEKHLGKNFALQESDVLSGKLPNRYSGKCKLDNLRSLNNQNTDPNKEKQVVHFSLKSFSQLANNFAGLLAQPTLPLVSLNWQQDGQQFNNNKEKEHQSFTALAGKENRFTYTNFASQNQQLVEFSSPWYHLANSRLLHRKTPLVNRFDKKIEKQTLPLSGFRNSFAQKKFTSEGKTPFLLNKKDKFRAKFSATHLERMSWSIVYSNGLQKTSLFQINKQPLNKKAWKELLSLYQLDKKTHRYIGSFARSFESNGKEWSRNGNLSVNRWSRFVPPHKNKTLFETEYGPPTGRVANANDGFFEIATVGNKFPTKRPLFNSLAKERALVLKSAAFKFNPVQRFSTTFFQVFLESFWPGPGTAAKAAANAKCQWPIQPQVEQKWERFETDHDLFQPIWQQGLARRQKLENLKRTQQFAWEAISLYSWLSVLQWSFVLLAAAVLIDLYRTFGVAGLETAFEKAKKEGLTETPLMMYYQNVFKLSSPTQDSSYQLYSNIENKFKNVRGVERHFPELAELVWWLRHGKKRFPSPTSGSRGYLLVGPPGTGKTLLVKALAGESEVPLLCQSMSLLCGKQGGETNQYSSRSANLEHLEMVFDRARESYPCLIFLDEIDSIGNARSNINSKWVTQLGQLLLGDFEKRTTPSRSLYNQLNNDQLEDNPVTPRLLTLDDQAMRFPGFQEMGLDPYEAPPIGPWRRGLLGIPAYYSWKNKLREKVFQASTQQTSFMLSLLQELDGIKTRSGVVVLASTNRPETLDQALLRPGRLERILHMELPNKSRRLDILKTASQYLGAELTVSWEDFAARTVGWSHAALATAVNESTLRALSQGTRHTVESIDWGLDLVTNERPMPPHFSQRKRTAFFQAGKAVLSRLLPNHPPVWRIRLDAVPHPQRRYKGRYRTLLEQLDGLSLYQSRGPLETCLIGLYGGKAGEIMYLKERNWQIFPIADVSVDQLGPLFQPLNQFYFDVQPFSHSFWSNEKSSNNQARLRCIEASPPAFNKKGLKTLPMQPPIKSAIKRGFLSSIGSEEINNATTLAWLMVDCLGFYGKRLGLKHAFQLPTNLQTRIEWRLLNSWKRWYPAGIAEDVARSWTIQPHFQTLGRIQVNDPFIPWFNRSAALVGSKWKDQNLPWYLQQQGSFVKNLSWYRIYTQFRQERYRQMQHKLPEHFTHGHDRHANLVDTSQRYQIRWNDIYPLQRDYLIHGLVLNSFTLACLILDQHRELLDLYASELLRYETLHANHMKQLMLLCQNVRDINPSCKKK